MNTINLIILLSIGLFLISMIFYDICLKLKYNTKFDISMFIIFCFIIFIIIFLSSILIHNIKTMFLLII